MTLQSIKEKIKNHQKGFLSIAAIAVIIFFAMIIVSINYLSSSSTAVQENLSTSRQALYIAESALEQALAGTVTSGTIQIANGAADLSADFRCFSITATGYVGTSSKKYAIRELKTGGLPGVTIWALTSSAGILVLNPFNNTWENISDRVNNANDIIFGTYNNGWIVGENAYVHKIIPPAEPACNTQDLQWTTIDLRSVLDNDRPDLEGIDIISNNEFWVVGDDREITVSNGNQGNGHGNNHSTQIDVSTIIQYKNGTWCGLGVAASACSTSYIDQNATAYDLKDVAVIDISGSGAAEFGIAVGSRSNSGGILSFNGTVWSEENVGINTRKLNAARVFANNSTSYKEAWAVGRSNSASRGVILNWNSTSGSWSQAYQGGRELYALDMLSSSGSATYGMAVGDNGTALEYSNGSWSSISGPWGNNQLNTVAVFATNDIWIGSNGNRSYHFDGSSWQTITYTGAGNFKKFGKVSFPGTPSGSDWYEVIN